MTASPPRPRPLPRLTGLTGEWYGWLARHELRFQRCTNCGRWRHVPRELCPECHDAGWTWQPCSGRGRVYSWTTTHRPLHPAFTDTPFAQVVVELDEGPRVLSSVVDVAPADLEIGMPLTVCFDDVTAEVTLPRFRRAADLGAAPGLTLAGLVREHAARRPEHPYLHYRGDTVSFGELDERTDRVAAALRAAGVGAGDRVALLDRNGPACLEVMFGAAKCGAVYVPVNWRLATPEIADILTDADPRVLFLGSEYTSSVDRARHGALTVVEVDSDSGRPRYGGWLDGVEPRDPGVLAEPDDAALLMYTSGTTGRPKGAVLTQSGLLGRMPGHGRLWSYDESSVNLVAMPLFHIGGTGIALEGIVAGATTVLMRDFDPGGALDLISTYRVTNTLLVPAMIQFMLDSPACEGVDWSTMRSLVYGAAPISETLLRRAMETMRCEFVQIYGMTEHSGCAASLPAEAHDPAARPELLRSCGLPLPWVEVAITDPVTGARLATGEVGEIRIRSSQVMRGYWNQPEQTAAALTPDGWYRTGDAGYQDGEGYLFIQDRVKDMIISGGENIYPAEIENVLMAHPGVRDIAVIGVPHERWGETPKAVVVAEPGTEPDAGELIAYCRERLAGYKCPTSVDIVDALPRNPSGKVLKFVLREPYWRGHDRRVS